MTNSTVTTISADLISLMSRTVLSCLWKFTSVVKVPLSSRWEVASVLQELIVSSIPRILGINYTAMFTHRTIIHR